MEDLIVALDKVRLDEEDDYHDHTDGYKSVIEPYSLSSKPAHLIRHSSFSDAASLRLKRDLKEIERDPPPLCSAGPVAGDILNWNAIIIGPPGTPYDGGIFQLRLTFSQSFPYEPPEVVFCTSMFHPNISVDGKIALGIFRGEWNPVLSVCQILLYICSVLNSPDPDDYLNEHAAILYQEDPTAYLRMVRYWVKESTRQCNDI